MKISFQVDMEAPGGGHLTSLETHGADIEDCCINAVLHGHKFPDYLGRVIGDPQDEPDPVSCWLHELAEADITHYSQRIAEEFACQCEAAAEARSDESEAES